MDANVFLQQDLARLRHAELLREATQHRFPKEPVPKVERPRRSLTIARLLLRAGVAPA
jgi:hypothetical protein